MSIANTHSLLHTVILDRQGSLREIAKERISDCTPKDGILWLHFDGRKEGMENFLDRLTLDSFVIDSLCSKDPRPRSYVHKGGLLIILRGVNTNPDEKPEDMVAIRVWIETNRIITVRGRTIMAVDDILDDLKSGNGPVSSADFLVDLAGYLMSRVSPVLAKLEDQVDELEESFLQEGKNTRQAVSELRRKIIRLRRYLAPQRDVMIRLHAEKLDWMNEEERGLLREDMDLITRYVEDLDMCRERAEIVRDEQESRSSERMAKTLYIFSLMTVIFLPLTFITGLLGSNVGGIPWGTHPHGFWFVCIILGLVFALQVFLFRKNHWL